MTGGPYFIAGQGVKITDFEVSFAENGLPRFRLGVGFRYDACAAWSRIALMHHRDAEKKKILRSLAAQNLDAPEHAACLQDEFDSSVQAIVAAASALDALYSVIKGAGKIPVETRLAWRKNGTARPVQVYETIAATFKILASDRAGLRQLLAGIYKLRDAALHPFGDAFAPVNHPEYSGISMEWRLVAFRADTADFIVCNSLRLIWDLARDAQQVPQELRSYLQSLQNSLRAALPYGLRRARLHHLNLTIP